MISQLEKLEIIGDNILKYWKKDRIYCKLDIINPNYKVKTANISPTNNEIKDFQEHIADLLRLGLIRRSDSLHRSAVFIVIKHSEQVRGSRMVINYKRLNDNTRDDRYNILDKTQLISRIQGCKIFSKFDLKSGF